MREMTNKFQAKCFFGLPRPIRLAIGPSTGGAGLTKTSHKTPKNGNAWVAQLVEHVTENHGVGGSIPSPGTIAAFQTHLRPSWGISKLRNSAIFIGPLVR